MPRAQKAAQTHPLRLSASDQVPECRERRLRHHRVTEGPNAVHPMGYPIRHSTHSGFNTPRWFIAVLLCSVGSIGPPRGGTTSHRPFCLLDGPRRRVSDAKGVGQQPKSGAPVGSTDRSSGVTTPLRIIPCRGKLGEDDVKPLVDNGGHIFKEDKGWAAFSDDAHDFVEQATPRASVDAQLPSGTADVLAGEPGGNNVDGVGQIGCCEVSDIGQDRCTVEVTALDASKQHSPAEGIDFAVGNRLAVRPKSVGNSADTRTKV